MSKIIALIVTFNLKDFPKNILQKYDIEAQHPDDFIITLFESRPLEKQSLSKLVGRLRRKNSED